MKLNHMVVESGGYGFIANAYPSATKLRQEIGSFTG